MVVQFITYFWQIKRVLLSVVAAAGATSTAFRLCFSILVHFCRVLNAIYLLPAGRLDDVRGLASPIPFDDEIVKFCTIIPMHGAALGILN